MVKILRLLGFIVSLIIQNYTTADGKIHHHKFVVSTSLSLSLYSSLLLLFISSLIQLLLQVKSASFTRLCNTKEILTVNGKFPGPTLEAYTGDELIVTVYNRAKYNITLHWHGARQVRNPWSDGPEYITQCPIQPGRRFNYKITLTTEEGTIWWHAHNSWARATVHGAVIIYPKHGSHYPFPKPHAEFPIILGEWWKKDVMKIPGDANITGGEPTLSAAFTINGEPGYMYPCSKAGTYIYIYIYIYISIVEYHGIYHTPKSPHLSPLPPYNGTQASTDFTKQFRSPVKANVPQKVDTHLFFTISVNLLNCSTDKPCAGPFGKRFAASMNNISFVNPPSLDILQAYYYGVGGVFERNFPRKPPNEFNYTAENLPANLLTPSFGVWLLHCHIERHVTWGMGMVFLVKNGVSPQARILKPPRDLPRC
ncbi:hypothetical protein NC651_002120 [Populus alba x Populus x berolinensis]|nr:hypothetical protein NC651_002120 [Populus alba x Populus x berolinensis]